MIFNKDIATKVVMIKSIITPIDIPLETRTKLCISSTIHLQEVEVLAQATQYCSRAAVKAKLTAPPLITLLFKETKIKLLEYIQQ